MNLQTIFNKELRHLNLSEMSQIASIIDINNNWTKILETIPKNLNNILNSNIYGEYERKYKSQDAATLRTAAQRQQRSPSFMLLFEEWGTSGRQRPTIQHLYELLISLPLYRAADHIADHILHIERPSRPITGPSQKIDITLPESENKSNIMLDYQDYCHPNINSIEHCQFDTNYENQDRSYRNDSSYNKSISLSRNESGESISKFCSSSKSTNITETDSETSEDIDTTRTDSSCKNIITNNVKSCSLISEQIWVDDIQMNVPDLSLLKILKC